MQPERRTARVVEAFMLIQTEVGRAEVVAKQLAGLTGVSSAEYVTGPYDVVVRVAAETASELQSVVVPSVQGVTGITRTLTCPIAEAPHS
jgi:DNA-binding Lrp family transcriptional regulator